MQYLSMMREDETLVIYSGHPLGLFPSTPDAPRVILTNGMVVPQYSSRELYLTLLTLIIIIIIIGFVRFCSQSMCSLQI
jgi:urocanate hydratase